MNARQARQRRHQWYYSPCAPFENSSESDQAGDSTNNLSKNPTTNSVPPTPPEPPPALAAPNKPAPEAPTKCSPEALVAVSSAAPAQAATQADDPARIVVPSEHRKRGISPELSPQHKDALFAGNAVIPSEHRERGIPPELSPLKEVPTRCQFSFSDGRHCRLPRAQHDPRFCAHHTENNVKAKKARKRSRAGQAIVELQTPSGKLTTATDLNYALSQVFRSLAQDRIRPRSAAALGYLGQLLLQTLPGVKSEFSDTFGYRAWDESVKAMLKTGPTNAAAIKQPQPPHNEHLRGIPPHPSQNQHLRKP